MLHSDRGQGTLFCALFHALQQDPQILLRRRQILVGMLRKHEEMTRKASKADLGGGKMVVGLQDVLALLIYGHCAIQALHQVLIFRKESRVLQALLPSVTV